MNYGIVAEFNPFHNGHKYIVDSLKNGGENTVTAVMSESFVQRSECACAPPYIRTQMALANGVDLVLSLPVAYSTASAERFAPPIRPKPLWAFMVIALITAHTIKISFFIFIYLLL